MASLDIFHQDAFTALQLTAAVEKVPFQPGYLTGLNLFDPMPIRTKALAVEERAGVLNLIQTSPRGAPLSERTTERRKMRYFDVPRIAKEDTLYADELQSIREFGQESELMQVQTEVARRLSGPTGLMREVEYTWENMALGAIGGLLMDADGTTALYNYFDEFQITQPVEVAFDLNHVNPIPGALVIACTAVVRGMARAAQGAFLPSTEIYAMAGDSFWDSLVTHSDVRTTYLNWQQAEDLRKGQAFESMRFGGINWFNYRGSDDTTTVGVATTKVKFFPRGAPGIFRKAMAPAETFDFVNTPGKPMYVLPIMDRDRNAWWKQEVYSYPLYICTRPGVLFSGRQGT